MRFEGRTLKSFLNFNFCLCAFCMVVSSSCTSGKSNAEDILGKWSVSDAYRNEKLTTTLEDGYFHFQNDSLFTTNIFSLDQEFKYELTDEGFEQSGDIAIDYVIEQLSQDTLILTAKINAYDFRFVAVRDTLQLEVN